jgi:hypothetical protein
MGPSPFGGTGDGTIKNPVQTAGFCGKRFRREVYRARRSAVPGRGAFFDGAAIHRFVIIGG